MTTQESQRAQLYSKSLLDHALFPILGNLADLGSCLPKYIPAKTAIARKMLGHIFASEGKKIRPAFYFLACNLVHYDGPHKMEMAAVTEYVHTASLLHDDVVDNSSLRRNKPTTNAIWGDQAAVLVGDLIYSTASEMMAATSQLEIVTTFSHAIQQMSEAELLQLEHVFAVEMPEPAYFEILQGKTGALLGAACRTAGVLAQVGKKQRDALQSFGILIGIAFQLLDDALDYLGQRELLGKRNFSDLSEGRITLPLILLRDRLTPEELAFFRNTLAQQDLDQGSIMQMVALVRKYKTAEQAIKRAQQYTEDALAAIATNFPKTPEREQLESLARTLLSRLG